MTDALSVVRGTGRVHKGIAQPHSSTLVNHNNSYAHVCACVTSVCIVLLYRWHLKLVASQLGAFAVGLQVQRLYKLRSRINHFEADCMYARVGYSVPYLHQIL